MCAHTHTHTHTDMKHFLTNTTHMLAASIIHPGYIWASIN